MEGRDFLVLIDQDAKLSDTMGKKAKVIQAQLSQLSEEARSNLSQSTSEAAFRALLEREVQKRTHSLQDFLSTIIKLQKIHSDLPDDSKPLFLDWIKTRKQEKPDELDSISSLEKIIDEPQHSEIRDIIVNDLANDKIETIVKSKISDILTLNKNIGDYLNEKMKSQTDQTSILSPSWRQNLPMQLSISAIIFVVGIIVWTTVRNTEYLKLFANVELARGFITLLFTLGVIATFLIVTAAVLFDITAGSREKYERAKTILSMLVGIFGTVLGFYFALVGDDQQENGRFEIAALKIDDKELNCGLIRLEATVINGESPFKYLVQVLDSEGDSIQGQGRLIRSESGALNESFDLSGIIETDKELITSVIVTAVDSKNTASDERSQGDITLKKDSDCS